eukprot:355018-Chlamydomonas_euryale.AAC.3
MKGEGATCRDALERSCTCGLGGIAQKACLLRPPRAQQRAHMLGCAATPWPHGSQHSSPAPSSSLVQLAWTPLHFAARHGHDDIATALLSANATVDARTNVRRSNRRIVHPPPPPPPPHTLTFWAQTQLSKFRGKKRSFPGSMTSLEERKGLFRAQ